MLTTPLFDSALFSFSASGGALRRLAVWFGAIGLAAGTVWFALNHDEVTPGASSRNDYELLQSEPSSVQTPIERHCVDDVKPNAM